jgi:hypothetical protein
MFIYCDKYKNMYFSANVYHSLFGSQSLTVKPYTIVYQFILEGGLDVERCLEDPHYAVHHKRLDSQIWIGNLYKCLPSAQPKQTIQGRKGPLTDVQLPQISFKGYF